jgi:hypothetical protein
MNKPKIFLALTFLTLSITLGILIQKSYNKYSANTKPEYFVDSYSEDKTEDLVKLESLEIANEFTIVLTGDVSFVGLTAEVIENDGADPFQFIRDNLRKYDVKILNLETNISTPGVGSPQTGKAFTFNSPLKSLDILRKNKIDAVSLANNHTNDYGSRALSEMFELLNEKKIVYFGAGNNIDEAFQPKYLEYNGTKIGLVGVNEIETYFQNVSNSRAGSAYFDEVRIKSAIETANKNADIVIVMPHWGTEHQLQADSNQVNWGRKFIDWGADIVAGAHPHVRQNHEVYKDKHIYYSLGNFIFSGFSYSEEAQLGYYLVLNVKDKKLESVENQTVKINYHGFPELITD